MPTTTTAFNPPPPQSTQALIINMTTFKTKLAAQKRQLRYIVNGNSGRLRIKKRPSALESLEASVPPEDVYETPESPVQPSFSSEVRSNVKGLQSIVDAMLRNTQSPLIATVLSYYSKPLILACGLAAVGRLIAEPESHEADDVSVKLVIDSAMLAKNV